MLPTINFSNSSKNWPSPPVLLLTQVPPPHPPPRNPGTWSPGPLVFVSYLAAPWASPPEPHTCLVHLSLLLRAPVRREDMGSGSSHPQSAWPRES